MTSSSVIKIGDVAISIEGQASGEIAPAYLPFIAQGKTDISLRLHHGLPDIVVGEKVFDPLHRELVKRPLIRHLEVLDRDDDQTDDDADHDELFQIHVHPPCGVLRGGPSLNDTRGASAGIASVTKKDFACAW